MYIFDHYAQPGPKVNFDIQYNTIQSKLIGNWHHEKQKAGPDYKTEALGNSKIKWPNILHVRKLYKLFGRVSTAPLLRQLHWLPIPNRIDFKIAVLTFKVLTS